MIVSFISTQSSIIMEGRLVFKHGTYSVRHWTPGDREGASRVVKECLEAYGLRFEPQGADLDAINVEKFYLKDNRGEFWVVVDDTNNKLVGTGGYYEVNNDSNPGTVEIRKMYLLPEARGKKLGRALLEVTAARLLIQCNVLCKLAVCSLALHHFVKPLYIYTAVCMQHMPRSACGCAQRAKSEGGNRLLHTNVPLLREKESPCS